MEPMPMMMMIIIMTTLPMTTKGVLVAVVVIAVVASLMNVVFGSDDDDDVDDEAKMMMMLDKVCVPVLAGVVGPIVQQMHKTCDGCSQGEDVCLCCQFDVVVAAVVAVVVERIQGEAAPLLSFDALKGVL
jgi:hypothetical protein